MITTNNHEEYFLLYLDGELSAAEKTAVEEFLTKHPQYQPVFDEFKGLYLNPAEDEVTLNLANGGFDKSILLKPVAETNWQEMMLMEVDKELPAAQQAQLQQALNSSPALATEMILLLQTVLPLEVVEHPNKKELLREEKGKVRPMIFRWTSLAAAAVVTGLLLTTAWPLLQSGNILRSSTADLGKVEQENPAANQQKNDNSARIGLPQQTHPATEEAGQTIPSDYQREMKDESHRLAAIGRKTGTLPSSVQANTGSNTGNPDHPTGAIAVNQPTPQTNNSTGPESGSNAMPAEALLTQQRAQALMAGADEESALSRPTAKLAVQTSEQEAPRYQYLNETQEDNRLYIGAVSVNKARVKGFFRKAAGLLGKTRPQASATQNGTAPEAR